MVRKSLAFGIGIILSLQLMSQSYVGIHNLDLCLIQERVEKLGTGSFVWGIKTTIGNDANLKLRGGFQIRENNFGGIIYLPILNLNLKTMQYSPRVSFEIRYYKSLLLFSGGIEIYKDNPLFYGSILINFYHGRL